MTLARKACKASVYDPHERILPVKGQGRQQSCASGGIDGLRWENKQIGSVADGKDGRHRAPVDATGKAEEVDWTERALSSKKQELADCAKRLGCAQANGGGGCAHGI